MAFNGLVSHTKEENLWVYIYSKPFYNAAFYVFFNSSEPFETTYTRTQSRTKKAFTPMQNKTECPNLKQSHKGCVCLLCPLTNGLAWLYKLQGNCTITCYTVMWLHRSVGFIGLFVLTLNFNQAKINSQQNSISSISLWSASAVVTCDTSRGSKVHTSKQLESLKDNSPYTGNERGVHGTGGRITWLG